MWYCGSPRRISVNEAVGRHRIYGTDTLDFEWVKGTWSARPQNVQKAGTDSVYSSPLSSSNTCSSSSSGCITTTFYNILLTIILLTTCYLQLLVTTY